MITLTGYIATRDFDGVEIPVPQTFALTRETTEKRCRIHEDESDGLAEEHPVLRILNCRLEMLKEGEDAGEEVLRKKASALVKEVLAGFEEIIRKIWEDETHRVAREQMEKLRRWLGDQGESDEQG